MEEVITHLTNAYQAAKDIAHAAIDANQPIEQHVLDTIKAVWATLEAVKAATGL